MRLCKGIYVEPLRIAYHDFDQIRASFFRALSALFEGGSYVGIATHDEWLIHEGARLVARHGRARDEYEFQMLLGVREARADELVGKATGCGPRPLRRALVRAPCRLQENPKIAGYIAADTLGRLLPGRNGRTVRNRKRSRCLGSGA